jgi:hypothetical protein
MLFEIHYAVHRIQSALQDQAVLEVADNIANKTTYGGASVAIIGGLTLNEWAVGVGIVLGVLSFFADIWFKRQRLKLMAKHKLKAEDDEQEDP